MLKYKKILKYSLWTGAAGFVGTYSYVYYTNPLLRKSSNQIIQSITRCSRIFNCGLKLIYNYKLTNYDISNKHKKAGKIIKDTLYKNQGTYIKIGQVISSLDHLFPEEICHELRDLFDMAPVMSYEDIEKQIKKSLNKDIEEVFDYFEKEPIKSASIGQVHKAILKENGKKVAVKIQHPWLKEQVPIDIKITENFVNLGNYFFDDFNYNWLIKDMKNNLPKEINFLNESKNWERIKELFKNNKNIKIPKSYKDYNSEILLVMEWVDGISFKDSEKFKELGFSKSNIANILSKSFYQQIFDFGFVHADPHPGNLFVRKKNGREQIILFDHGLYTSLSKSVQKQYKLLWKGIIKQNEKLIKNSSKNLNIVELYKVFVSMITEQNWDSLMEDNKLDLKERLEGKNEDINLKKERMVNTFNKHYKEIILILEKMNPELVLLFKINDYIAHLNRRLEQPINTFYWIAYYSLSETENNSFYNSLMSKIARIFYLWGFSLYGVYLNLIK